MRTARIDRAAYARAFKIQHRHYELSQYPNFRKALHLQVKPVIDFVKHYGVSKLESHLSVLVSEQPMKAAYIKCYTSIGVEHAGWVYNKINEFATGEKSYSGFELKDDDRTSIEDLTPQSEPPSLFSEHWRKLMKLFFDTQGADRVTQVTDTTKEQIRQLLKEAQDQNLTLSEQATYIEERLNDPDFNRDRALRIARTESTTASNYSALLGADSSDYETGKIWIPILDANTRPAHAEMDGEPPIALDDSFNVGGELLAYPGDIAGSPGNVIQCRCALAIVPLLDSRGLPVLK